MDRGSEIEPHRARSRNRLLFMSPSPSRRPPFWFGDLKSRLVRLVPLNWWCDPLTCTSTHPAALSFWITSAELNVPSIICYS